MGDNSTIQSLVRGMKILELLAENGRMTATDIAAKLGIHQSSASRLLNSLVDAGMVHKPKFKSFEVDYGILLFAGKTINHFPLITRATLVCDKIVSMHPGYNATVGIIFRDRVVYLTTLTNTSSLVLIDNRTYPIYKSSLGRLLAYRQGREKAIEILSQSVQRANVFESAEAMYENVDASVKKYGFLFMGNEYYNKCNAALDFKFQDTEACLAVYSKTEMARPEELRLILDSAIAEIREGYER